MRSFFVIFALLFSLATLAPASALKGVRGIKRTLAEKDPAADKMEKKCKKWAPKAVAEPHELKASKGDKKDKGDAKAKGVSDEKGANTKTADKGDAKMPKDDGARFRRHLQDDAPKEKESHDEKLARAEEECLEWFEDRADEGGSSVVTDPSMGSTSSETTFDSINADCDDIANDKAPSGDDIHTVSFKVGIDVLKEAEATLNDIYDGMEKELQQKVAPRIAGCSSGSSRFLASSSSKIVHVDFKELEFDHQGCDSSLGKEASSVGGVCMASDVPVDVYFVGDFPENAIKKVEVAIEEHEWSVDGLLKTSEVDVVQTGSSMSKSDEEGGSPGGMIGGIVAAVAACLCAACGYGAYKRNQGGPIAKAELDTDEESDDDYDKKKVAIPEVEARQVR